MCDHKTVSSHLLWFHLLKLPTRNSKYNSNFYDLFLHCDRVMSVWYNTDPGAWILLTFQDDDDLQVLGGQRLGGELVQRTPSLHGVADDQRRNQEDAITPQGVLHLDVQLTHRDHLALRRHSPPDHLEGKLFSLAEHKDWKQGNNKQTSWHLETLNLYLVNLSSWWRPRETLPAVGRWQRWSCFSSGLRLWTWRSAGRYEERWQRFWRRWASRLGGWPGPSSWRRSRASRRWWWAPKCSGWSAQWSPEDIPLSPSCHQNRWSPGEDGTRVN